LAQQEITKMMMKWTLNIKNNEKKVENSDIYRNNRNGIWEETLLKFVKNTMFARRTTRDCYNIFS
jgi:hypothetical protein